MSRLPYSRSARVGELIQHELGNYFLTESISERLTVTHVKMSDDLKHARVYLQALGKDGVGKELLKSLNRKSGLIKREISRRLELRHTPEMIFFEDEHFAKSQRLMSLIQQVSEDLQQREGSSNA
jgi:ribosome-binding factor A